MRIIYIVIFILLLTGCTPAKGQENPPTQRLSVQGADQVGFQGELTILSFGNDVEPGGFCSLTVLGQPGVTYRIVSLYNTSGDRMMTAYEDKTADADGRVTWRWNVGRDTVPGTYPVAVSGGGKTLRASYTVRR